jgi:outer membrane scaffolding protein for murein synthesis (MipA/OmpV family)
MALLPRLALLVAVFAGIAPSAFASDVPTYAFGAAVQRMPAWMGSRSDRSEPLPYIDVDIPDFGEFSTNDGVTLDAIRGEYWHGGFYGDYRWGRTTHDLGRLGGRVRPLSPRLQAGGYVEYAPNATWTLGTHLSHDTDGAGAYLDLYVDWQLPNVWLIEHSLEVQWTGTNRGAMQRFFGLSAVEGAAIGASAYRPGAGSEQGSLEYDAFIPTSRNTGIAIALVYGRLQGRAASSPLVERYGSRTQLSRTMAFVYHF